MKCHSNRMAFFKFFMKENQDKEKAFDIYELAKIIEETLIKTNSGRPIPFEDEGAYAEDDE